jgi:hypothetical protein
VERTADPSAALGMTKERAVVTVEDCFHGLKLAAEKAGKG